MVAIVVPDSQCLARIASSVCPEIVISENPVILARIAKDERVKAAILEELFEHGKKSGLKGFEIVKNIAVVMEPFSVENGTLTPTLKIKRYVFFSTILPLRIVFMC